MALAALVLRCGTAAAVGGAACGAGAPGSCSADRPTCLLQAGLRAHRLATLEAPLLEEALSESALAKEAPVKKPPLDEKVEPAPLSEDRALERHSELQDACAMVAGKLTRPDRWVDVSILSAPANVDQRTQIRASWLDALRRSPLGRCVRAFFVIGHAELSEEQQPRRQGVVADEEQMALEKKLDQEARDYGDITRIALPDKYQNLPDKTLMAVQRSVRDGFGFVLKVDDDQFLDTGVVQTWMLKLDPKALIYGGVGLFREVTSPTQLGPGSDGDFKPYFSGTAYLLSQALAERVALPRSAEFVSYGTSSEDVDMGRWVEQATGKDNVDWLEIPVLVTDLPKI